MPSPVHPARNMDMKAGVEAPTLQTQEWKLHAKKTYEEDERHLSPKGHSWGGSAALHCLLLDLGEEKLTPITPWLFCFLLLRATSKSKWYAEGVWNSNLRLYDYMPKLLTTMTSAFYPNPATFHCCWEIGKRDHSEHLGHIPFLPLCHPMPHLWPTQY